MRVCTKERKGVTAAVLPTYPPALIHWVVKAGRVMMIGRGLLRDFPLFHDIRGRPPFPLQHAVAAMGGAETCHSTCMLGHDCTVVLLKSYCGTLCVILIAYFAAC